eukprot:1685948-Amphidinium_carterae.1
MSSLEMEAPRRRASAGWANCSSKPICTGCHGAAEESQRAGSTGCDTTHWRNDTLCFHIVAGQAGAEGARGTRVYITTGA